MGELVVKVPNGTMRFADFSGLTTYVRFCNKAGEEESRLEISEASQTLIQDIFHKLYCGLPPLPGVPGDTVGDGTRLTKGRWSK
jgi:hypothetical protein